LYKYLLCWRYLLTRYLALACIVSVMLGVATLIVVNSVMSGFSTKLKDRLHGLLSDVDVEAPTYGGFANPEAKMERIRQDPYLRDQVEAMAATMEVFAMLQFTYRGVSTMRPVHLIGVDPKERARVGGFAEHLVLQKGSAHPSFTLPPEARRRHEQHELWERLNAMPPAVAMPPAGEPPPPDPPPVEIKEPVGIIVGYTIASYRSPNTKPGEPPEDIFMVQPGDDVILTTLSGERLTPVYDRFVVCDYFKSEMSEYDQNYVFVPLDYLQRLRTMENRVTGIQIKLKDYHNAPAVVKTLQGIFPDSSYLVLTWEQKQGPLLAAISIEKGILNVLLFMIICVAGFGILAIFAMIVVEKTRDIGILKALGASNGGVMKIFLGYGLLLGLVGATLGTSLGLVITININDIQERLAKWTGLELFPSKVYYFDHIPTNIEFWSVALINLGALFIAVLFSVLPALRAAWLHPVRALRYE
jgi:lipoprotein-releasing system permease protein